MALKKSKYLNFVNPVYNGDRPASKMELSILTYDSSSAQMQNVSTIEELLKLKNESKMSWINISGLKDIDSINRLGELLEIHALSIEDILHTDQQAKMEVFEEYRFLSVKIIQQNKCFLYPKTLKKKLIFFNKMKYQNDSNELIIDQLSIIIKNNVLLTFQELSGDLLNNIRKKILEDTGEIRKMEIDYLAYLIVDSIIDEYFHSVNYLEDYIDDFEERATQTSDNSYIEEIQEIKKYLLQIRRAILPLKDNLVIISRQEKFFQTEEIKPFLQDLNENLNHTVTLIEHYREWLSNIMDVNLSVLSYQMNKVMKVLAMISSIFIPLTFIAGIYGMNFNFMPELGYALAYPIVLCVMGFIATVMIIVFKVYRWF